MAGVVVCVETDEVAVEDTEQDFLADRENSGNGNVSDSRS